MNKKQRTIIIWLTIWVGLLVGVLYSPMGSPDLYNQVNYTQSVQGVNFSGMSLSKLPHSSNTSVSSNEFNGVNTSQGKTTGKVMAQVLPENTISNNSDNMSATAHTATNQSSGESSGSAGGGIGGGLVSSPMHSGQSNTLPASSVNSFSVNNDLASSENPNVRQGTGYTSGTGATDPGADTGGQAIPVGEGWSLMLIFAFLYVLLKIYTKQSKTVVEGE